MAEDAHYFRTPPAGMARREIDVTLAGREIRVLAADGVFSADRLDPGTAVLLRYAPDPPAAGNLLDLGCGWGPIALDLALRSPGATVWAVDVNDLAVELTAGNARRLGLPRVRARRPEEVPADVSFAAVRSNPPIRVGKAELHRMLETWLPRLAPGGQAHLVVQRNLGADSLHRWLADDVVPRLGADARVERVGSARGYRVLHVTR